jgi:anti-anti-sigma factor
MIASDSSEGAGMPTPQTERHPLRSIILAAFVGVVQDLNVSRVAAPLTRQRGVGTLFTQTDLGEWRAAIGSFVNASRRETRGEGPAISRHRRRRRMAHGPPNEERRFGGPGAFMVHIHTSARPTATRLAIRGQLDMTTRGAFDEALTRAARSGGPVEIDLGDVDFIDGCGLSVLMDAQSRAQQASHKLTIVAASRSVRRLIAFTDTADSVPPLAPDSDGPLAR